MAEEKQRPEPAGESPPRFSITVPTEIAAALVKLQSDVRGIAKTAENGHFKNTYAPLDEVMDTALPLLTANKLSLMQFPVTIDGKHILHSVLAHESGASMQTSIELLLTKQDPQGLGSAITYERRQTVMAILGLSAKDEDDDGNKASNHLPPPTQAHLDEIAEICKSLKFPDDQVEEKLKRLRTDDQAVLAISDLDKIIAGRAAAIRARKATEHAVTAEVTEEVTELDRISAQALTSRLEALRLQDPANVRAIIRTTTKKPFLKNCTPQELGALADRLDNIESGEEKLPDDWVREEASARVEEQNNELQSQGE